MSVHIIHDTKGAGVAALERRLRIGGSVKVGVRQGTEENGVSIAKVAAWTEFGTQPNEATGHPGNPERPFLRVGIRLAKEQLAKLAAGDLARVARGEMSMFTALSRQGLVAVGSIQKGMTGPNFKANEPSTVAKKGSSQPTIHSGMLRQSVTFFVDPSEAP